MSAKTTLSPARHSTERTAWFRPSDECARKATSPGVDAQQPRGAGARPLAGDEHLLAPGHARALEPPKRSQAAVCDRSHGASPPVQRWATPSRPTNSLLSIRATIRSSRAG